MARQRRQGRGDFAVVGAGSIWDGAAYWAIVVGVYLMVGGLFFYSGQERLFDQHGHPPAPIQGTASLFQYFGATVVILALVSLLPPNRPDNRLRLGTAR